LDLCHEALWGKVQKVPDLLLFFVDLVFRPLAVIDVNAGSVPSDDLPLGVSQRLLLMQHPAIYTVRSSHARFDLQRPTAFEAGPPPRDERGHVVRVDHRGPFPALEILQSQPNELEPALVEEIQVPVGETRVDQRGKGIDELPWAAEVGAGLSTFL